MDKLMVQGMFAKAVKAKLEAATKLGVKASWRMSDHLDAAAQVICECVKDEVEFAEVRKIVQATYNHSAFAQKLEKDFEVTRHFQRSAKVGNEGSVDDLIANLARETAAAQAAVPAAQ